MTHQKLTIAELSRWGRAELSVVSKDKNLAALETDALLADATQLDRAGIIAHKNRVVSNDVVDIFKSYISRRKVYEPVAYILGKKEFFSLEFMVTPDVLIPRPETELVVERVLELLANLSGRVLLIDIGTGSGAIVLSVLYEWKNNIHSNNSNKKIELIVKASDISSAALKLATLNAKELGLLGFVEFIESDCLDSIVIPEDEVFDSIIFVSNPPYVSESESLTPDVINFEPAGALFAGKEGLDIIQKLIAESGLWRDCSAYWVMEIGETQGARVKTIFQQNGFKDIQLLQDLWGKTRVVEAVRA